MLSEGPAEEAMSEEFDMIARCFIANPGGTYDPVELPDLDMPAYCMPAVGDFVFDVPKGSLVQNVYRVVERHFEPNRGMIALIVEVVPKPAVSYFG